MIQILKMGQVAREDIFARSEPTANVGEAVREIIARVREEGDGALFAYTEQLDGAKLSEIRVSEAEMEEAFQAVEPEFAAILNRAAANIRAFHARQVRNSFILNEQEGVVIGQKIIPIEKVGLYVPGGTAAYPSTVLMDAIPATIAGCGRIVMTTPCGRDGKINPVILVAARVAGVDEIYKVGGAQAIAALAYGTQTVPRVDKIVGPGNAYVAEAKRQVFGQVSIDMIAGPSEILIVADGQADPRCVAADMLSQAEHDKMASAVLVTDSLKLAEKTREELERQIPLLDRRDIARASIDGNGKIIVADSVDEAIAVANEIAPEHLELCLDSPFDYLDKVKNAGSIFLGRHCPEALGDYFAGPNHTLPTSGTARFSSPLSVDDFVKKSQYTYYTRDALARVADDIAAFANREGLTGHARSVLIRREVEK